MKQISKAVDTTVGCDPEVFLVDGSGSIVSAIDLIGGSKEAPRLCKGGSLQEDNIMAEIGTNPTSDCGQFLLNLDAVMSELVRVTNLQPLIKASAYIDEHILMKNKNRAFLFGCEPDYNAYTGEENPNPSSKSFLRTCAGHIHLGYDWEDETEENVMRIVQYMDYIVGLWTVLKDEDTRRRSKYGKAGAFRYKQYGLEYRVPSNFWLKTKELSAEMFHRTKLAFHLALNKAPLPDSKAVIEAINTSNVSLAEQLLGEYSCPVQASSYQAG